MRYSIALLSTLLLAAPVNAQTLWQNVDVGMTPEQVAKNQPDARPNPRPSTLGSGAKCLLHIPAYEVAGDSYEACFFFEDGGLIQVMLSNEAAPTKSDFDEITAALKSKYGEPISIGADVLGYHADWVLKNGVNVSVTFISALSPLLNINYQTRIAKESSKL